MNERLTNSDKKPTTKEIRGKIIFDKFGNPIGIAVSDASLDQASHGEKEKMVMVIKPQKKGK